MKYTDRTFTVPLGSRDPQNCSHGWINARGCCQFCGERIPSHPEWNATDPTLPPPDIAALKARIEQNREPMDYAKKTLGLP